MFARPTLTIAFTASLACAQPQILHDLRRPGTESGGQIFPCTWTSRWGGNARPAGDVNGDGHDDLMVIHVRYANFDGY